MPGVLDSLLEGHASREEYAVWELMVAERMVPQAKRDELAKKGHAMPGGTFPIETASDAQNALTLYRSGHHKTSAARAHILRNAKRVGAKGVVAALQGDSDSDGDKGKDSDSDGD